MIKAAALLRAATSWSSSTGATSGRRPEAYIKAYEQTVWQRRARRARSYFRAADQPDMRLRPLSVQAAIGLEINPAPFAAP